MPLPGTRGSQVGTRVVPRRPGAPGARGCHAGAGDASEQDAGEQDAAARGPRRADRAGRGDAGPACVSPGKKDRGALVYRLGAAVSSGASKSASYRALSLVSAETSADNTYACPALFFSKLRFSIGRLIVGIHSGLSFATAPQVRRSPLK